MRVTVYPGLAKGGVIIPASKSLAHRSIICAALAKGTSVLQNVADSLDIQATCQAMSHLGAVIKQQQQKLYITGVGGIPPKPATLPLVLNCKESGSTLRFLIPLLAAWQIPTEFRGEGRLLARPQSVYQAIFAEQGLGFQQIPAANTTEGIDKLLILGHTPSQGLTSGIFTVAGNLSSQFITGLLLALPLLQGDSIIKIIPPFESASYVSLTLQVLSSFGINAQMIDPLTIAIPGNQAYQATTFSVEGDFSQAAFFGVLAAIKGEVICHNLNADSLQGDKVIVKLIQQMGGKVALEDEAYTFGQGKLKATDISLADCPDLGPILAVLAAYGEGTTVISNAERLAIKESNRLEAIQAELAKAGVNITATAHSLTITGCPVLSKPLPLKKPYPEFWAHNDHRIAMSLAIFLAAGQQKGTITGADSIQKSYPQFFTDLQSLGIKVDVL